MAYTTILPEEFDGLVGVSDGAFRLYMWLRQYMHRPDGEAFGAGVTWGDLSKNGLYVAPARGVVDSGLRDKRQMMRLRDELVRAGLLEDVGDKATFLRFRFPIFIQNREVHFSVQNKPAPNPHPLPAPNEGTESGLNSDTYDYFDAIPALGENAKPAPSPVFPDKENTVLSKYAVTDKSISNFHAKNLLTEQQIAYWEIITSLNIFRLQTLFRADKLDAYAAMLGRWEAAKVKTDGLKAVLIDIHNEACKAGKTVHSPLYFENSVMRLAGETKHETGSKPFGKSTILDQLELARRYGYA